MSPIAIAATSFILLSTPGAAQQPGLLVSATHLDQTMDPQQVGDVLADCLNNESCNQALKAAATYAGVPGEAVTVASVVAATYQRAGETGEYGWDPHPGYSFCRVLLKNIAINPPSGERAPYVLLDSKPTHVRIQAWTPMSHIGGGRTWVEGDLIMTEIPAYRYARAQQQGVCTLPPGGQSNACRGSGVDGDTNGGMLACHGALSH